MTQYERTSIPLTPEQKRALDRADRPMSEIVRDLVDAWRQKDGDIKSGVEVAKEELEQEIESLDKEINQKEKRKELKREKLERLEDDKLHPKEEQVVEELCEKVGTVGNGTALWLNPKFEILIEDYIIPTLDAERAVLEVAKRADKTPVDDFVHHWRRRGFENLTPEKAPTDQFANGDDPEPPGEFVVNLLKTRDEALPDDYEPELDKIEIERKAVSHSR